MADESDQLAAFLKPDEDAQALITRLLSYDLRSGIPTSPNGIHICHHSTQLVTISLLPRPVQALPCWMRWQHSERAQQLKSTPRHRQARPHSAWRLLSASSCPLPGKGLTLAASRVQTPTPALHTPSTSAICSTGCGHPITTPHELDWACRSRHLRGCRLQVRLDQLPRDLPGLPPEHPPPSPAWCERSGACT